MTDPVVATLWVDLLGQLAGPATHAVNNALNNVAINLAVIQSRPGAGEFAQRADAYLTEATEIMRSVLALVRAAPAPIEPASVVHQVVAVLETAGRHIEVQEEPVGRPVTTSIDGTAVRLALAGALIGGGVTRVQVKGAHVRMEGAVLQDDVADAVRQAGVGLRVEPGQITFTFL